MTSIYEVIDFIENDHAFFKSKVEAWNHMFDFLTDVGLSDEVRWLRGERAFVAVDLKAMDRLIGIIEHGLVDS